MKIIFLGDISLNGKYIEMYNYRHNPFKDLSNEFHAADYIIGNLESIAKGEQGENVLKKPRLTTTVDTLNYLKNIRLNVACLANNHVYDHLDDGFLKTIAFLKENDIKYFGAGHSTDEAAKPIILEKDNFRIGLLNYVTRDTNPKLPEDAAITPNFFEEQRVIAEIAELKKSVNHVILSLHWGGRTEGGLYPDYHQPALARRLIDSGADLIIGHHSHTVQPYETYKGKYIFYSLGNFCFSDFTFDNKFFPLRKAGKVALIVSVFFNSNSYNVKLSFAENNNGVLIENAMAINIARQKQIFRLLFLNKFFWTIYYIYNKHIRPLWVFVFRKDLSWLQKYSRIKDSFARRIQNTLIKTKNS